MKTSSPLVSVIIPTRNNATTLEACLRSIRGQTYPNIEVIVVDNNSTDNTKDIALHFTDFVYNHGPERSAQRNYGANHTNPKSQYLLMIDSDMELTSRVVAECVAKVRTHPSIKAVVIPEESFGEGFWAQCKALERSFYVGVDWIEAPRFFTKAIYSRIGGYDKKMTGAEDWALAKGIKGMAGVGRTSSNVLHNEQYITLRDILKKRLYYSPGFTLYYSSSKRPSHKYKEAGRMYALYLSNPARLLANPLIGAGMLYMRSLEFMALMMGGFVARRPVLRENNRIFTKIN